MADLSCLLPGGYVDSAGVVHRHVALRPLCGQEEELLAGNHQLESASLVTMVLGRCLRHLGPIEPVPVEIIRHLLVADRQYLLLKLHQATFGDHVYATVFCPWPDCGHKMDMDFSIGDVPVKESEMKGPTHSMQLSSAAAFVDEDGQAYQDIAFRLPTGEDQEILSPLLAQNEAQTLTLLLERCLRQLGPWPNPRREAIGRLSPLARMEIERQMEAVAPQLELAMTGNCLGCGREFTVPFDLQSFFFGELRSSRDLLYREVHYLAYHYHWSEREIMEMTRQKRRNYIEVLAEEIERLNDAIE